MARIAVIALRIEFVAGQFHLSPWNASSTNGETEWPPAPWRLLRTIVAGWKRSGAADRAILTSVLDALAECPVFELPQISSGHTRHGRPADATKPNGALKLDSFIALAPEREHRTEAFAIWPAATLSADERRALDTSCAAIRDLGSPQAPCTVTAVTEVPSTDGRFRVDLASRDSSEGPTVRRLAAGPLQFGAELLHLLDETPNVIGRTAPAGSGWVEYRMPLDFGWVAEQALQREMLQLVMPPAVMRFTLHPEARMLPGMNNTVVVAEKVRQAVLKRHSDMNGTPASKRLAGKQHDGSDRREGHDHPFFLPFDRANRGVVDGVDIWLPAGCTQDEFLALSGIARIWDPVVLRGAFTITYAGEVERETGNVWHTATPVILDRFPKHRGPGGSVIVDAPAEQLRRALAMRGFFPTSVEIWNPRESMARRLGGGIRLDTFRRGRIGEPSRHPAIGATLRFDRPATGPIVLGRLAHFGLGRFEPEPPNE